MAEVRYDGGAEIDVTLTVGLDCDVGEGRWHPTDTPFDGQRLLVCDFETEACGLVPVEESGEFPQTQVFPPLMFKGLGFCQVGSARSETGRPFRIGDRAGPTYTYTVECSEHPDVCEHTVHMIVSR